MSFKNKLKGMVFSVIDHGEIVNSINIEHYVNEEDATSQALKKARIYYSKNVQVRRS